MNKALFFRYNQDNSICIPAERIGRTIVAGSADLITMYLDSATRVGDPQIITLSVASGKGDEALRDINEALSNSRTGVVVIADNVSDSYISGNITGVALTLTTLYTND